MGHVARTIRTEVHTVCLWVKLDDMNFLEDLGFDGK
jgi:hypothetical protein